jgi:hypothetical protein
MGLPLRYTAPAVASSAGTALRTAEHGQGQAGAWRRRRGEICYYDSPNNALCYYRTPNVDIVIYNRILNNETLLL